jgi:hypothetical protein
MCSDPDEHMQLCANAVSPENGLAALTFYHPDFTVGPGVSPDRGAEEQ